ncbi:MAG: YigZ family protein [Longimicrobiales bacterium]
MTASGGYPIPARPVRVEEVIQRSRFLTALAHAPSSEAAHHFLQTLRDEHPDATHHCWAFVAGPPGTTASVGMSDDGEPHGTAGRPMLTALLHSGVGEIVAVSVRWYGGTKLGTGGLQRAYSGGVRAALERLEVESRVERARIEIVVGYPDVDGLQRLLDEMDGLHVDERYGGDVRYVVDLPEVRLAAFERALADLTQGQGRTRRL